MLATDRLNVLDNPKVGIVQNLAARYPSRPDRDPLEKVPTFSEIEAMLREVLALALGTSSDNPLNGFIQPGDRVLIKPNQVLHFTRGRSPLDCLVTHWSLIFCMADLTLKQLKGRGSLLIGDAPIQGCDFDLLTKEQTPLAALVSVLQKKYPLPILLVDFRRTVSRYTIDSILKPETRTEIPFHDVDLGIDSLLHNQWQDIIKYRTIDYSARLLKKFHQPHSHLFRINQNVLDSDVIINIPKLKTHCKTGITVALKNTVGILAEKQSLPHHRQGPPEQGGDEYEHSIFMQNIETKLWDLLNSTTMTTGRWLVKKVIKTLRRGYQFFRPLPLPLNVIGGSWYGNDTLWRSVLDLNRICLYGQKNGSLNSQPSRRYLVLVDGITAGEGEGPLTPSPKQCGLLLAAQNPVALDSVAARLMGFDYRKLPLIYKAGSISKFPLINFPFEKIEMLSNVSDWNHKTTNDSFPSFQFKPSQGWENHIEFVG